MTDKPINHIVAAATQIKNSERSIRERAAKSQARRCAERDAQSRAAKPPVHSPADAMCDVGFNQPLKRPDRHVAE
jgi:hypothetical protein